MDRTALSMNESCDAAFAAGSRPDRAREPARQLLRTAPADLFFTVVTLGIAFALSVALCLWRADAPRHDEALRDVGQNIERLIGEIV